MIESLIVAGLVVFFIYEILCLGGLDLSEIFDKQTASLKELSEKIKEHRVTSDSIMEEVKENKNIKQAAEKLKAMDDEVTSMLISQVVSVIGVFLMCGFMFLYLGWLILGLFTAQAILFGVVLILGPIHSWLRKKIKNETIRKIMFKVDTVLTLAVFVLIIIDKFHFKII